MVVDTTTAREQKLRIGTRSITSVHGLKRVSGLNNDGKMDKSLKQRAKGGRKIVLNNLKPCTDIESYRQRRKKRAGLCKACNKNVHRQGNNTRIEGALGRRSTGENGKSIDAEVIWA